MGGRKHHEPLFLDTVRESDTMVECTPETVHKALTVHFEKWYAMPQQIVDDPLHNGEWQEVLQDFPTFYAAVRHTQVPEPLCQLIYRAIMHTPLVDTARA